MKRGHLFASILLLAAAGLAQQPSGTSNPQDTTANPQTNPTASPYTRSADQPYNRPIDRPVETGSNWGGWGLLGLLGLGGLLGRKRETTGATYMRDERTEQQRRRAG